MKKTALISIIVFCLPFVLFGQEIIEKIEIEGNERVTAETILYYLSAREGDYFSLDLLRKDFKVLWSTGFFANIKIEQQNGTKGKIVKIKVEENPVIKDIIYKTGKKVKEDAIVNKLKEQNRYLLPYSYYSPYKVQQIKNTIEELLSDKGISAGKVESETSTAGKNELAIVFRIDEGPKIRVSDITFEGKTQLPENTLLRAFKENKKHGLLSWIGGKDAFKENKLSEDIDNLRTTYHDHGYMEAIIGQPKIEEVEKRTILFKKQQMKKLIIPIEAGERYTVGSISIEGNKVFNGESLRSLIKYEEGDFYSTEEREEAVKKIGELYQNFGHLYAQIRPVESLDPKNKRVNVNYNIYEGEVAHLNRLSIQGNTYTKDKVIRREILIREGDRFSFALFKDSILRMNQLGLVELDGEPEVNPNPEDPTLIDVKLKVKEMQRNNIQFTAGYSGYQGPFVAISYGTVNFLGAGEKLDLTFQYGKRIRNYMVGFTEPYIFDRPISLGFSIYNRYYVYPGLYDQKSVGSTLNLGMRLRGYWSASLAYSYEYVTLESPSEDYGGDYYSYYGYSSYSYGGIYSYGKYNVSSITPAVYRNTVDNPLTPSRGSLYLLSCKFAGGILGGDVSIIKPRIELARYIPTVLNQSIGLHLEYQFIHSLSDSDLPFWEKFYLGGERSIRGYDIYTIGPRSDSGQLKGGTKSLVLNFEYIIPVGGPLYAILFYDAGNAFDEDNPFRLGDLYTSAGLEARIFVPALRVPFRLIFAYNNRFTTRNESHFNFRFAIGTTF
ncbi:MAG: outer membrane protein assembly factor BamA [Candidatus Aminicenantes bacterium]|nr:outer membrane protein assembly factor BamA [Candidatus Aminicenantes bacterium]